LLDAAWRRRDRDTLELLSHCIGLDPFTLPVMGDDGGEMASVVRAGWDHFCSKIDEPTAGGVVTVGLYFNALRGWEETDDFDEIEAFITSADTAIAALPDHSRGTSLMAAWQMLNNVTCQWKTEDARLCACSHSMGIAATHAVEDLKRITLAEGRNDIERLLLDIVRQDRKTGVRFYGQLATTVAPLAGKFAKVIIDVNAPSANGELAPPRASLRTEILTALPGLHGVARKLSKEGEVLGGELAVQAQALEQMAGALGESTLALHSGALIYVYPFTLETPDNGGGIGDVPEDEPQVERTLELANPKSPISFRFQKVDRTDAWESLEAGAKEIFREFSDRGELLLSTGYELRFRPKWVEMEEDGKRLEPDTQFHRFRVRVVLGKHGGHYLTLETRIGERVGVDPAEPEPWSGADIDQWVRRLTADAGADRVSLHENGNAEPLREWGTLHAFAQTMVAAVNDAEHPNKEPHPADVEAADDPDSRPDLTAASVIFAIDGAHVIGPDGQARPAGVDLDIGQTVGYTALTAKSRYLPASVEEWIRLEAAPPDNLLEGLRPKGDTLLVNGEVMALLAFASPNWVVLEQIEIFEFAVSVHGYLQEVSDRLRDKLRNYESRSSTLTVDQVTKHMGEVAKHIRMGNSVLELLRSRGLLRSRYHAELLRRIFLHTDAQELDARIAKTVEALRDVRRELEDDYHGIASHDLNLSVFSLTVVAAFAALYEVITAWLGRDIGLWTKLSVVAISAVVTGLAAVGYLKFRRYRSTKSLAKKRGGDR